MGFDNWGFVLELADTASELEVIGEARCGSNTNVLNNREASNVFDHAPNARAPSISSTPMHTKERASAGPAGAQGGLFAVGLSQNVHQLGLWHK